MFLKERNSHQGKKELTLFVGIWRVKIKHPGSLGGLCPFISVIIIISFHLLISQVDKQINTILQKADYKTETKVAPPVGLQKSKLNTVELIS